LLKIVQIVILICSSLFAKDYFISFRYSIKNFQLTYSKFNCSKALSKSKNKGIFLFSLPCDSNIKKCCKQYEDIIAKKLLKLQIYTYSHDKLNKNLLNSTSKLTFTPKRFGIILKDGEMKFYLKGED